MHAHPIRGEANACTQVHLFGRSRGGLSRSAIIDTLARRLPYSVTTGGAEALQQMHRIAELRLNDLLGVVPTAGRTLLAQSDMLARWSDDDQGLTCAFTTLAHQAVAAQSRQWREAPGLQSHIDTFGSVIGRYPSDRPDAATLTIGARYDIVRDAEKFHGRLGNLLPITALQGLRRCRQHLRFHVEVIGFSEEDGVRFKGTFLGSSAVAGHVDERVLVHSGADDIAPRAAFNEAGYDLSQIASIVLDSDKLLGCLEVYIEQGPALLEQALPLGAVSAINGSCRYALTP